MVFLLTEAITYYTGEIYENGKERGILAVSVFSILILQGVFNTVNGYCLGIQ